jgi:fucose 4-O-acetylase-like acetyltransferase
MNPTPAGNLAWIDTAKGIGIILVVAGHIFAPTQFSRYIFWFHMPLFFFLSGYLFKKPADPGSFTSKRAWRLLVPYLTYLALLSLPQFGNIVWDALTQGKSLAEAKTLTWQLLYGGKMLTGWFAAFWFVTCLFCTQQIYAMLSQMINPSSFTMSMVMVLSLGLATADDCLLKQFTFPLGIDVVCMAVPIFWLGNVFRTLSARHQVHTLWWALAVGLTVVYLDGAQYLKLDFSMKGADYGLPPIGFLNAVAWSVIVIHLARRLSRNTWIRRVVGLFGANSLCIMFLHQSIQMGIRDYAHVNNGMVRTAVAIVAPVLFALLCRRVPLLRTLFLGEPATSVRKYLTATLSAGKNHRRASE